mmetsp:Transcript_5449/g.10001  ORF Transcript_5449/g.10001 Transcript_5449/m.10001 type:complete len:119 (-) Transcript_5449:421-777(-)
MGSKYKPTRHECGKDTDPNPFKTEDKSNPTAHSQDTIVGRMLLDGDCITKLPNDPKNVMTVTTPHTPPIVKLLHLDSMDRTVEDDAGARRPCREPSVLLKTSTDSPDRRLLSIFRHFL